MHTAFFLALGVMPVAGQTPAPKGSGWEMVNRFDRLTPGERSRLLEKLGGAESLFEPVVKADLVVTVVERGTLEPLEAVVLTCPTGARTYGATVRRVVDEGTMVKKGDLVLELDSSRLREQLRMDRSAVNEALTAQKQAEESLKHARKEADILVRDAEIEVKIAELRLKKYAGGNAFEEQILELLVEQARLAVDKARSKARSSLAIEDANVRDREGRLQDSKVRVQELEEEIAKHRLTASRDGLVIYAERAYPYGSKSLAAGETVKEGEKLVVLGDPDRLFFKCNVHESLVSQVRRGQNARVQIDAYANNPIAGKVTQVARLAAAVDWLSKDVKVFPTRIELDKQLSGLKPGMSGEAEIETARKTGVLQVPVRSLVRAGSERFCYVKGDKGIHKRKVQVGLTNDRRAEITAGLKEGEEVVANAWRALRRLANDRSVGTFPKTSVLRVRSVAPTDSNSRGSYGLTRADWRALRALPEFENIVPVRRFAQQVRRLQRVCTANIIGSTTDVYDLLPLHISSGRFFSRAEESRFANVAVIGSAVAAALFVDDNPIGQTILVNRQGYRVIGVLAEAGDGQGAAAMPASEVYIPFSTCNARFGERLYIPTAGTRRAEPVQIHEILCTCPAADIAAAGRLVRDYFGKTHVQQDWAVGQ